MKINIGEKIQNGPNAEIKIGNCLPLQLIPVGIDIHNVELLHSLVSTPFWFVVP